VSRVEMIDEFLAQEARSGSQFSLLPWADRRTMLEDDLFAGRSVTLVLTAIVAGGMLLMAATVAYIVF
jgi:hypothetical protein